MISSSIHKRKKRRLCLNWRCSRWRDLQKFRVTIEAVRDLATAHNLVLQPYGGGENTVGWFHVTKSDWKVMIIRAYPADNIPGIALFDWSNGRFEIMSRHLFEHTIKEWGKTS